MFETIVNLYIKYRTSLQKIGHLNKKQIDSYECVNRGIKRRVVRSQDGTKANRRESQTLNVKR